MPDTVKQAVLDASALLAYLGNEVGADVVADAVADGATISAVNLAEALSTLAVRGGNPTDVVAELTAEGVLDGAIAIEPFTSADAIETARLRPITRWAGLSLGDRSCLALAHRLSTYVLTADRSWIGLTLDVDVHAIRE
jgi:ribonuclease VapC